MMTSDDLPRDAYGWHDAAKTDSHDYLLPPLIQMLAMMNDGHPLRVVDLGCGNGYVSSRLAERRHSVVAVDASSDGIAIARQTYPGVRFELCSIYDDRLLNLVGGPVDCVIALEVIEHLFYPKRLFQQSHRLLRSGGHFVVSTPYHGYLKNLAISVLNRWDRHFDVGWDGGHIKFFSKKSLAAMAFASGFQTCRFAWAGRIPGFWKSMIMVADR